MQGVHLVLLELLSHPLYGRVTLRTDNHSPVRRPIRVSRDPAQASAATVLTVGQLATRTGVRTDTVRYYEREGLLPVPQRTGGEHRRYGSADVDRLLFIRGAQRLGLRLAEIRGLLAVRDTGTCPCEPAEGLLRRHVAKIETEMARLTAGELTGPPAG
jgi:DNA-binding transcriptional MerR regulator